MTECLPDVPVSSARHPIEGLFEHLSAFGAYSEGVVPLWARIPGFSFFPGGAGMWEARVGEPLPEFPMGGIMVLGHNYYSIQGFRDQLENGKTDDEYATGRNLGRLLDAAGIPKADCFFTNFFMGLNDGPNTGTFRGNRDKEFVKRCQKFLRVQLKFQRPRLVLVLGAHVPRLLAPLCTALEPWKDCRTLEGIDKRERALVEAAVVDGVRFTAACLTHPSLGPANFHRRAFRGFKGEDAEIELLRVAWNTSNRATLPPPPPDGRAGMAHIVIPR